MVNSRYLRQIGQLKGPAKKMADDMLKKRNPPFFRIQQEWSVPDEHMIKTPPFVDGDRVQIIAGPDKGKIGRVQSVFKRGNSCFVEGLGGTTEVVLPKALWSEGQSKPVAEVPNPISYKNLRLVSEIKNEDGTVEDVAIHSVIFKGEYYDEDRNCMMPIRRARFDHSVTIPYPLPLNPTEPTKSDLATAKDVVDERTFFPDSLVTSPVPMAALDQIRYPHSKWRKRKDARPITQQDIDRHTPPAMPQTPATKKLLAELANMKKPAPVEFTTEIEDFIGKEIEQGLQRRVKEETANLAQYK